MGHILQIIKTWRGLCVYWSHYVIDCHSLKNRAHSASYITNLLGDLQVSFVSAVVYFCLLICTKALLEVANVIENVKQKGSRIYEGGWVVDRCIDELAHVNQDMEQKHTLCHFGYSHPASSCDSLHVELWLQIWYDCYFKILLCFLWCLSLQLIPVMCLYVSVESIREENSIKLLI